jgi:anti-sigma regulatory factor (Ser/Thr protein kinase)
VPNVLCSEPDELDTFFSTIAEASYGREVTLDMGYVNFVHPLGTVALFESCRFLAKRIGGRVCIAQLKSSIHAYLRRIDFFELGHEYLFTSDSFSENDNFSRSSTSSNVLELVRVNTFDDVYLVKERARKILDLWLSGQGSDVDRIVTLISEACANVVEHSGDWGLVTIQKYEHREHAQYVEVKLAISDFGIGIRRSLADAFPGIIDTCSGYIERALGGLTARPSGRGGQGLGAIQRIAVASGGSLYLRSETGSVYIGANDHQSVRDNLSYFPGTQLSITFRSNY